MSYKYKRGEQYESRNRGTIENLSQQYADRSFEYDPNTDKAYQDYANMMRESGAKAMADTMGKATAASGGYDNSYAVTAGQQVYNDFAREIGAAQDDFYNQALARFETEGNILLNKLSMAEQKEARDKANWEEDYAADLVNAEREGTAALAKFYGFKDEAAYNDYLYDQQVANSTPPTQEIFDAAIADYLDKSHFSGSMSDEDKIASVVEKYASMGYNPDAIAMELAKAKEKYGNVVDRTWTRVSGNGKDAIYRDEFGNEYYRNEILNSAEAQDAEFTNKDRRRYKRKLKGIKNKSED